VSFIAYLKLNFEQPYAPEKCDKNDTRDEQQPQTYNANSTQFHVQPESVIITTSLFFANYLRFFLFSVKRSNIIYSKTAYNLFDLTTDCMFVTELSNCST